MDEAPKAPTTEEVPPTPEVEEAPPTVEVVEGGEEVGRLPLPRRPRGEVFGIASQLLGAARIRVMCEDSVSRMGRITGKMKKKMWIREGDLLIIRPWGFQEGKADILFRFQPDPIPVSCSKEPPAPLSESVRDRAAGRRCPPA